MKWTVRSSLDSSRYVSYSDEGGWHADELTVWELDIGGGPFANARQSPVGPFYESTGDGDVLALYLHAAEILPGDAVAEPGSELPQVPEMPELPDGAVA